MGGPGFFSRLRQSKAGPDWDLQLDDEVERVTRSSPPDVMVVIPASQAELGARLELVSSLMKAKGYRLRQVVPESATKWAASFMLRN